MALITRRSENLCKIREQRERMRVDQRRGLKVRSSKSELEIQAETDSYPEADLEAAGSEADSEAVVVMAVLARYFPQ